LRAQLADAAEKDTFSGYDAVGGLFSAMFLAGNVTLLENWLEGKAGVEPYQGGFLLHYLDKLVYPDISATVLTVAGVVVCVLNLLLYARQMWIARHR
jgi:hypothetical protein